MSQVNVGSVLRFRGYNCICSMIRKVQETTFARENHVVFEAKLREPVNCVFIDLKIQPFEEKQIIDIEFEMAELTAPGQNVFFVYTKYYAHLQNQLSNNPPVTTEEAKTT